MPRFFQIPPRLFVHPLVMQEEDDEEMGLLFDYESVQDETEAPPGEPAGLGLPCRVFARVALSLTPRFL